MKRIAFPLIIVLLLLTACASATPAATQAPAEQPAESSSPTADGTQVDVTLADNTIQSSQTTFQVGVPYAFVITNAGNHIHNFNINTPVATVGSMDAALSSALLVVTREQLGPGKSVTVQYTFPDSAVGAELEFSCLIRQHYSGGMRLAITVMQ